MTYELSYPEKGLAVIIITVPKDEFASELDKAKEAVKSDDENIIRQYAISAFASQALAAEQDKLKLATQPALTADTAENGDELITLTCKLLPEVELGQYKGFNIPKEETELNDEELMLEINRRLNAQQIWRDVPEGTPAEEGDRVVIDFAGKKDGVAFDGGTGENYPLVLGSHSFIPGFEEQLIGIKAGEKRDINVTFPEQYFEPSLAGQPVVFEITCKNVQKAIEPKLDDTFIQALEMKGVKTVDEFRDSVKAEMEAAKKQEAELRQIEKIVAKVVDASNVDVPQEMINSQVDQMVAEYNSNFQQHGLNMDQFLEMTNQTLDAFKKSLEPQALNDIKTALILEAIATKEDLHAEEKEIEQEYALLSRIYGFPAQQLSSLIPAGAVAYQIEQKKAMDFLKEHNED